MKFLQQVAQYYINAEKEGKLHLRNYTFVFPNKRSAMFMRKYLRESLGQTAFMPKLITITSFSQSLCRWSIPSNSELLYMLFDSYRRVMKDNETALDFDKFLFWGNIILSDFNDIDAYLADPQTIFDNLENLNSIQAQYLTPEQKEVADALGLHADFTTEGQSFWKQFASASSEHFDTESKHRFLRLWQILGLLYTEFHKQLKEKGLVYSGLQSRMAYEKVKELTKEDFGTSRYAFVGFYVLPTSRYKIFQKLRNLGIADFFWDNAAPLLSLKGNRAGALINPLAKEFPAPKDFQLEKITKIPNFEICPVPSNVGQTKLCALKLNEWNKEPIKGAAIDSVNTAVVMPNDRLLLPFIYALPKSITKFNVAMRVPFSSTPFATLLQSIMLLQERARLIRGELNYFYKDVLSVISHPYIGAMAGTEAGKVRKRISQQHLYNIPASELCQMAPILSFMFLAFDQSNLNASLQYFLNLLDQLSLWLRERNNIAKKGKADEAYELQIIQAYRQAIEEIAHLSEAYSVNMKHTTFFSILRRALLYQDIPFTGDPVGGLQILGVQDSRVLDFDNLVFLSLNERIFPPRGKTHSLIPQTLRVGYALPTIEDEQITFAYQFYRITARASRIALFYDSRPIDNSKGEVSRFVTQLVKLLPPSNVKVSAFEMDLTLGNERSMLVEKTESVMDQLKAFTPNGEKRRNFSASTFKDYIKCPMLFYLKDVCRMNLNEEDPEYISPAAYGTVMHAVAQEYFDDLQKKLGDKSITPQVLKDETANTALFIARQTQRAMRIMDHEYYLDKYKNDLSAMPGEGRVLSKICANYMLYMLENEIAQGKIFKYQAGEYQGGQHDHVWQLRNHSINFTMSIDRIDEMLSAEGPMLRFIDYKTGNDEKKAADWEDLFTNYKKGAVFQLLTYALAYRQLVDDSVRITPYVYKFTDFGRGKKAVGPVEFNGRPIFDCDQKDELTGLPLLEAFEEKLNQLVEEIFSPNIPFEQTADQQHCDYCSFASMCGRVTESNN